MSELVKCATCKTEKPFSEMQTCMHAEREHSVCDMNCMIKFYKGEIKPDAVVTPDLEEMGKLVMNPKEYHLHKGNLELTAQLAKANERVKELEKQFETQMTNDFVTTTDQAKRITELEKYNLDLANESHKYQERCAELEKELANKDLLHVGFTNGAQIKYAKVEEGAFYPDTEGDCYIPLYMLKSHEHRIETTSFEQLRKEQE